MKRVWRGTWQPTYKSFEGWWRILDWPWRLSDIFGALFVFLGPLWIAMIIYYGYTDNPQKALAGAGIFSVLWLLLVLLAYWRGGEIKKPSA